MSVKYAVIFEQAECNWAAYVPHLPGCITTGRTLEETERNIRKAIEGHLKTLREFGDSVRSRQPSREISKSSRPNGSISGRFGVLTSASPRCLDGGDVDILHRHHRLEGTLCLTAAS